MIKKKHSIIIFGLIIIFGCFFLQLFKRKKLKDIRKILRQLFFALNMFLKFMAGKNNFL